MIPSLYRERMGQVPATIPTETYEDVQTTVPGVVGMQLDPERLRMLGMLGPEGMQAATQLAQFERSMQAPARQTVTAKPGERVIDPTTGEVVAEVPTAQREVKTKTIDVGNKILVVDEANPGQILASYPKARDTTPKDVSGTEITVGKNFEASVQPYVGITQAYKKVEAAANDPSAAGDLSLIFGFMKILDPASTVREGEYASAEQTRGIPESVVNSYNKALSGRRLTTDQREKFDQAAGDLVNSQKKQFEQQKQFFTNVATSAKANPANVIFDPYQGLNIKTTPPKPPEPTVKSINFFGSSAPTTGWSIKSVK